MISKFGFIFFVPRQPLRKGTATSSGCGVLPRESLVLRELPAARPGRLRVRFRAVDPNPAAALRLPCKRGLAVCASAADCSGARPSGGTGHGFHTLYVYCHKASCTLYNVKKCSISSAFARASLCFLGVSVSVQKVFRTSQVFWGVFSSA